MKRAEGVGSLRYRESACGRGHARLRDWAAVLSDTKEQSLNRRLLLPWGGALVVEPRYLHALASGLFQAGFAVR